MGRRLILLSLAAVMLSGCKAPQNTVTPHAPLVLNNSDSLKLEKLVETRMVPVNVRMMLPQQSETKVTATDTSHVETDIAESDAWVNDDGTLGHSIRNKAKELEGRAMVPQTIEKNNREVIKEKEVPVPQPYEVEIERELTRMEQIKLAAFWYLIGFLTVSIVYIFRKPLFTIFRKLIRLE